VWHNVEDFTNFLLPFPHLQALAADFRMYHQMGVRGVLAQATTQMGVYGEFEELRTWVINKLLWDSGLSLGDLVETFCRAYYGPAADAVVQYYHRVQALGEPADVHLHLYSGLESGFLGPAFLEEANTILNEAVIACGTDLAVLERVRRVRLCVDYAYLIQPVKYSVALDKIRPTDWVRRRQVFQRFKETIHSNSIGVIAEQRPVGRFLAAQEFLVQDIDVQAVAQVAPIVMKMYRGLFDVVKAHLGSDQTIPINHLIHSAIKRGFHPLELNGVAQTQQILTFDPSASIWDRKVELERLAAFLDPPLLPVQKADLPAALLPMLDGIPEQFEDMD
jgi:hypothetical protein